ncbi:MAG: citrate lyase ACP, partial [Calditrichaeota bacterium]|nr:citrate lyase ACP [Calditrichota bacterium]
MSKAFFAGRKDDKVRSDCWVSFETTNSGSLEIIINSKVESMYGDSIR